jgi:hypothetical protein
MNPVDGKPDPVVFPASWCSWELEGYRPAEYMWERYPYDTVPPLDPARFTGRFDWFDESQWPDPDGQALVAELNRALGAVGLGLPQDFVIFQTHQPLRHLLVEISDCWSGLSLAPKPLPSPVERGAYLLQFLSDQQDCVTWYLYLRPGQTFVVHAHGLEFEDDGVHTEEEQFRTIFWCAPSFEQFAYRFWVETRIAELLYDGQEQLITGDLREYLNHYRKR